MNFPKTVAFRLTRELRRVQRTQKTYFQGFFSPKNTYTVGKVQRCARNVNGEIRIHPCTQFFVKKCDQRLKIFREVSHTYENGQENTKFGGGSKSEVFGPFEGQVGANFEPKTVRINMIGSSGSGQPPQGPPPQPVSASNEVPVEQQHWVCDQCRGNWYETNLEGADWMTKKTANFDQAYRVPQPRV